VATNRRRRPKRLLADRGTGAKVRLWRFDEDRTEAEAVARAVEDRRDSAGDVAILYRTNAQSRPFEEELVRRRIPYVVVGGMKFYERAEVKDALAYLRLAARPEDDLAFRRVVNVPARGIGAATLDRIAAPRARRQVLVGGLGDPPAGCTDRARTALARFRAIVEELRERRDRPPSALLEHLLERHGLRGALRELGGPRGRGAPREHRELSRSAREFERRNAEGATVAEYLDTVALATDADAARTARGVTLSTLHAAKGSSFDRVRRRARGGLSSRTASPREDEDELEEERRLLYVGMTRAEGRAHADVDAAGSSTDGRAARPSRFLDEIPKGATEERSSATGAGESFARARLASRGRGSPSARCAAAGACATRATATA
jgi:DNA helicase-2/ATP-dependent DNA helicase PcrA